MHPSTFEESLLILSFLPFSMFHLSNFYFFDEIGSPVVLLLERR